MEDVEQGQPRAGRVLEERRKPRHHNSARKKCLPNPKNSHLLKLFSSRTDNISERKHFVALLKGETKLE